jgi:hypothetical protein
MAGLAATLNATALTGTIATALSARGPDGAICPLTGPSGVALTVAVRAVIPAISRVVDGGSGAEGGRPVAAFAVDGVATASAVDAGYAEHGPTGLLGVPGPYAVVLADVVNEALVLARNGDGPGLYYSRHNDGWLVASEPGALLRAGVPAAPDREVVRRFIATGECDTTEATFFAAIWRVLPDEAVVLTPDGQITTHRTDPPPRLATVATALADAVAADRVGIVLAPGPRGAAVLGSALARADRPRPLPVYTATFGGLRGPNSHTPAVLVPMPYGAVRHTPHTIDPARLDLEAFLRDLGEPVPDLDLYILWALARTVDGEVDTLVDASAGGAGCVARVSDRLRARYGVSVRCPLREPAPAPTVSDLSEAAARGLSPAAVRYARTDSARPATAGQLVLAQRAGVAAALATARPWADQEASVDALRRLHAGQVVDADLLLRTYLVERWLAVVGDPAGDADPDAAPAETAPSDAAAPADLTVGGVTWARLPVRTDVFAPGDQCAARAAWYVSVALGDAGGDGEPWMAILSAKVVAVTQRRARPLWEVRPRLAARALARLVRPRLPRLGQAWTMQVALDEGGLVPMVAGVTAAALGADAWAGRLLPPAARWIFPPRPDAVPPADAAVVGCPRRPDDVAVALGEALRYSLPSEVADNLAGCAVVSADETGCRVLAFAPGPAVDAVDRPEELVSRLCADNPAGQGGERSPVVLAVAVPQGRPREPGGDPLVPDRQDVPAERLPRNSPRPARDGTAAPAAPGRS